jgi:hypothetical protein
LRGVNVPLLYSADYAIALGISGDRDEVVAVLSPYSLCNKGGGHIAEACGTEVFHDEILHKIALRSYHFGKLVAVTVFFDVASLDNQGAARFQHTVKFLCYTRCVGNGTERAIGSDIIKAVVREAVDNGNPMMDISALYVSESPGEKHDRGYGMDFMDAVRGTERHPQKMSVDQMYFGYPETSNGYFRRFKIIYSVPTDSMEVTRQ